MSHRTIANILMRVSLLLAVAGFPLLEGSNHYPHQMIFLGDSISDNGNAQPSEQIPSLPYPLVVSATPITNGLTFAGLLGSKLDIGYVIPSTQGGLDFAYAGALVLNNVASLHNPGLPIISLFNQVGLISREVSRRTPVFSFGGANDFLRPILDGTFIFPTGASVADAMVAVLEEVHSKGFKTQIVSNMPNLGAIPFIVTIGESATLTPLSEQFNAELTAQLETISFPVVQVDTASLFSLVTADPAKYGFPNGAAVPAPNANLAGYMFYYDGVHPSEALDRIFAEYVFSQFEAANGFGNLAEFPLAVFRQQNTAFLQQLYPLQPRHESCDCGLRAFISGNVAPLLKEDTFGFSRTNGWGGDVTVGLSQSLSDCLVWGVGASYTDNHNKGYDKFKSNLQTASGTVFGSYYDCNAYANLVATGSWLDFSKIHRRFNIGPVEERTRGKTTGEAFYGLLNGGFNLYNDCSFSTGPIASLEYGAVRVAGYREHGAEAGNLKFHSQTGHAFISGIGWEANFAKECDHYFGCLPAIEEVGVNMSLSINRQWIKNHRYIHFKEASIDGAYGALPYHTTRSNYFSGVANLYAEFCNQAVFSAGYFFNVGTYDLSEHCVTVGLSMPFSF